MWGDEDCCLSHTKGSDSLDIGIFSNMFSRGSSPFSLTDLDMWDTKSRFTAQTAAWSGMASVSGTGFMSNVGSSTSGSTGGFRQNDPGLRKWQSLSQLVAGGSPRPFPPSPRVEIRSTRAENRFRQPEVGQWLQDAHERLDNQLDRLRNRNSQLSYSLTSAQLLDMKHKQLAMSALEQQKEAAELSQYENSRQRGDLHEKVLQLEKNLLQMRSTLDRESNEQPMERTPDSLSGSASLCHEDLNGHERQSVDTELYTLREALRDAEARAKTQEEERNQALQDLQTSTETQRTLWNQIEEMNQRLSLNRQNHSEVQEQLSEANNKISEGCLEKAILSTQVCKLEENIKELKGNLRGPLSNKDHLIKEKADLYKTDTQSSDGCDTESHSNKQETDLMNGESQALKEVNEKLTCELKTLQSQLQEKTAERDIDSKKITDLKAKCSQLIIEKEKLLSQMNEVPHEEVTEMREKCLQLRKSEEALELENVKLQDRCLRLEAEVLEKEERLQLQEEEHRKQDAMRIQSNEGLKAVASHWTEKWQKVSLVLRSTQEELEELKKNSARNKLRVEAADFANEIETLKNEGRKDKEEIETLLQHKANMETLLTKAKMESDSLLRFELDTCKQELERERSRNQALLHRHKGGEAGPTQDKETVTDLSESSLLWEPPSHSHSSQNESPQKVPKECRDDGGQANDPTTDLLRAQLEESRRRTDQLQKLQALRQSNQVKDEKPSVEERRDGTVCPVNLETEQQRRMVTEQLKSLFKEREGKEAGMVDSISAAAQTGASLLQDWTLPSKVVRNVVDRRSWQQGSGLMPVFEEDEENSDWPGEEAHPKENIQNQSQQMSLVGAGISNLNAENENVLQATLRSRQTIQECPLTAERKTSEKSSDAGVSIVSHGSDEIDLQRTSRPIFLFPDGTFLAELVDICSPDEAEEDK